MTRRLVFGVDRDPGEHQRAGPPRLSDPNPCVVAFGPGPEGKTCRSCVYLFAQGGVAGHYLKCHFRFRGVTGGYGTDHKAGWPACSRYIAR